MISPAPRAFAMWDSKSCQTARGSPVEPDVKSSVPADAALIWRERGDKVENSSAFQKPPAPIHSARLSASGSGKRGLIGTIKQSRASNASKRVA